MRVSKVQTRSGDTVLYVMNFNSDEMQTLHELLCSYIGIWGRDDASYKLAMSLRKQMETASDKSKA